MTVYNSQRSSYETVNSSGLYRKNSAPGLRQSSGIAIMGEGVSTSPNQNAHLMSFGIKKSISVFLDVRSMHSLGLTDYVQTSHMLGRAGYPHCVIREIIETRYSKESPMIADDYLECAKLNFLLDVRHLSGQSFPRFATKLRQIAKTTPNLESLRFGSTSHRIGNKGLVEIAKLTHLQYFSMYGNQKISDLGPLTNCKELRGLHFSRCHSINDKSLIPLANLAIESLLLEHCENVTDIGLEHLAKLPLKYLNLKGTQVTPAGAACFIRPGLLLEYACPKTQGVKRQCSELHENYSTRPIFRVNYDFSAMGFYRN